MNTNIKKFIEESEKSFEKDVVDYFWNKETIVGTQRLSINHIERIKNWYSSRQISLIKMIVEMVESEKKESTYPERTRMSDYNVGREDGFNSVIDTISSKLKELIKE